PQRAGERQLETIRLTLAIVLGVGTPTGTEAVHIDNGIGYRLLEGDEFQLQQIGIAIFHRQLVAATGFRLYRCDTAHHIGGHFIRARRAEAGAGTGAVFELLVVTDQLRHRGRNAPAVVGLAADIIAIETIVPEAEVVVHL